jgi:hypothetical protein
LATPRDSGTNGIPETLIADAPFWNVNADPLPGRTGLAHLAPDYLAFIQKTNTH